MKEKQCYHDVQQPFESAEEVWFWFIKAQEARNDGARYTAGLSLIPRPCEPNDILKILDRLYRQRALLRDHLMVLRHYGRRQYAPDSRRAKEAIAYKLWHEAFEKIEPVFIRKEIVSKPSQAFIPTESVLSNQNISEYGREITYG